MKKMLLLMLSFALVSCVIDENATLETAPGSNQNASVESGSDSEIASEILEMTVGPNKVDCVGMMPMKCLVVNGQYFYDEIEGFQFESGYNYRLQVKKTQVFTAENAPADASLYRYSLVSILSKVAD